MSDARLLRGTSDDRDPVPPTWAHDFEPTPRQRMYALMLAMGDPPASSEEGEALAVLARRIVSGIPIRRDPDWPYIAARLRHCGYIVGSELEAALEELVVR